MFGGSGIVLITGSKTLKCPITVVTTLIHIIGFHVTFNETWLAKARSWVKPSFWGQPWPSSRPPVAVSLSARAHRLRKFFYRKCIIGVIGGSGPNSVLKEAYLRLPNPWRDLYRTKTAVLLLICSTYLKVFHYNAFLCQHPIPLCNTAMALYWCLTRLKVR